MKTLLIVKMQLPCVWYLALVDDSPQTDLNNKYNGWLWTQIIFYCTEGNQIHNWYTDVYHKGLVVTYWFLETLRNYYMFWTTSIKVLQKQTQQFAFSVIRTPNYLNCFGNCSYYCIFIRGYSIKLGLSFIIQLTDTNIP